MRLNNQISESWAIAVPLASSVQALPLDSALASVPGLTRCHSSCLSNLLRKPGCWKYDSVLGVSVLFYLFCPSLPFFGGSGKAVRWGGVVGMEVALNDKYLQFFCYSGEFFLSSSNVNSHQIPSPWATVEFLTRSSRSFTGYLHACFMFLHNNNGWQSRL